LKVALRDMHFSRLNSKACAYWQPAGATSRRTPKLHIDMTFLCTTILHETHAIVMQTTHPM
jgi:hypothetical protein